MNSENEVRDADRWGELIRRSQQGETEAMKAIYERLKSPAYNIIYRYMLNHAAAEDLLHDVFIKVFDHIQDVNRPASFQGWVFRIAVNTCLNELRKRKGAVHGALSLEDLEVEVGDRTQDDRKGLPSQALEQALTRLPAKLKGVFLLHDVQGYKHEEIASMMGWSVGTSKSQLFRARMRIREFLKDRHLI